METALTLLLIAFLALLALSYFGQNTRSLWDAVPASFDVGDGGSSGGSSDSGSSSDSDSRDGSGGGTIVVCDPSPCDPAP